MKCAAKILEISFDTKKILPIKIILNGNFVLGKGDNPKS